MTLPFHPLATLFPLIEGDDFDELVADVREHGLREKIALLSGAILDGRNRFRALAFLVSSGEVLGPGWGHRAGLHLTADELQPDNVWFSVFSPDLDGDPVDFVISRNLKRRHLSKSQRAMLAADIEGYRHGGDRSAGQDAQVQLAREAAARGAQVSERYVAKAAQVKSHGSRDLAQSVRDGRMSVSAAAEVASLPAERQAAVLAQLPRDDAGNLTADAIKQLKPLIKEVRVVEQAQKRERREEREEQLAEKIAALPDQKFGVIYADPEWRFEPYSRDSGMDRAADNHYPTSVTEAIAARPVQTIAADDCVLFLWATAPMLPDALQVMAAWGFAYRSHLIWKKDRVGTGYWFRNRHELLLIGMKGNVPAPAQGDQWPSVVDQMVTEHSAKPDVFYELIEAYFPNLPKIELNARRARQGWTPWGLDAPDTTNSALPDPKWGPASEAAAAVSPDSTNQAAATLSANAHGCTASDAAAAAAELPAAAAILSPAGDDVLDIPAFLKRSADNVAPFMRGKP